MRKSERKVREKDKVKEKKKEEKEETEQTPSGSTSANLFRLRPISTSANSASWPKSNCPKSSILGGGEGEEGGEREVEEGEEGRGRGGKREEGEGGGKGADHIEPGAPSNKRIAGAEPRQNSQPQDTLGNTHVKNQCEAKRETFRRTP